MAEGRQKKIYLWTVPRSISTAFLRSMLTVDKCKGIFEPYLPPCFRESVPHMEAMPTEYGLEFEKVRSNMQQEFPGFDLVFIKEMPGHLAHRVEDNSYFPKDAIHTFLIRHPVKTLQSQLISFANSKDFTPQMDAETLDNMQYGIIMKDQNFEPLLRVYKTVTETYKRKPIVVDADDLQADPEGTLRGYCAAVGIPYQDSMLHWGEITSQQKQIFQSIMSLPAWPVIIGRALEATEFVQSKPSEVKVTEVEERYRQRIEENLKIYEQLRECRIKP